MAGSFPGVNRLIREIRQASASHGEAPQTVRLSLRRAAAGLIAAACVQVAVCVVIARSWYPVAFSAGIVPVSLALILAGARALRGSDRPAGWIVALCGLFAAFSVIATWAISGG